MSIEQEYLEGLSTLQCAFAGNERATKLLEYAIKERNFKELTILDGKKNPHSLAAYTVQLYFNAYKFGLEELNAEANTNTTVEKKDPTTAPNSNDESYQLVALMVALERVNKAPDAFGAMLEFDLSQQGVVINRYEMQAVQAQNPYLSMDERHKLMDGNKLALAYYGAHLITVLGSLASISLVIPSHDADPALMKKINSCWGNSPLESTEKLLDAFAPACLGEGSEEALATFKKGLRRLNYYTIPAGVESHRAEREGLAKHSLNVFWHLISMERPTEDKQIGQCLLAAVGHDFCMATLLKSRWEQEKVFCKDGTNSEPDGRRFNWVNVVRYEETDGPQIDRGYQSMRMVNGYLKPFLPRDVAEAIVSCRCDRKRQPRVHEVYMQNQFALRLHFADMLATHLDEAKK